MPDQTLASLTAATPATERLIYGTQDGEDRKFTLTAAGAAVLEATMTGIQTLILSGTQTLTSQQCNNGVVYVTANAYITLPAIVPGMSVTLIAVGATSISVQPGTSDFIYVDGIGSVANGNPTASLGQNGDKAVLTYYSANTWYAATNGWSLGA